jgi:hypothetical protein
MVNFEIPDSPKINDYSNGHWNFDEPMGVNGEVGFIYVIRDVYLDKFYLGKKLFRGTGKLNKGQESNWKKYFSSSNTLGEHIKIRPREEFEFICLEHYKAKGALSYAETWSLCLVEAPTSDRWYNKRIEAISWSVREGVTDRHKRRLAGILEGKLLKDIK